MSLDRPAWPTHHRRVHVGDRIKIAREARGFSQVELAEMIGKGQTTVSSWERGRTEPTREDVVRIAERLRLPVSDIDGVGEDAPRQARFQEVPLISWVSAGQLREPGQVPQTRYAETMLTGDLPGGEYFATEVVGDSMNRVSPEGSRIIVNVADRELRAGRFYLFSLRGEATYKRFQDDPVIRLEPFSTNPANQIIFPKADKDWNVIGRVVRSYLNLDQFKG